MECNGVIGGKFLISMFIFILLFHRASLSELSSISFPSPSSQVFPGTVRLGTITFFCKRPVRGGFLLLY